MNGEKRRSTAICFMSCILRDVSNMAGSDKKMHEIVDALTFMLSIARDSETAMWEEEREDEE